MTPIAGNTGRVADVTLSFRTPGSQERITQTVALDYAGDPAATPEEPYLSAPEMAERFAMYNMFLGLRAATQSYDLGCATAVLNATRAGATAWNLTHEDPDIAADLMLVDQYLANLRAYGAAPGSERPVATCATATEPYPGMPYPIDGEPYDRYPRYACSAGGATGGLPILLGAFAALGFRRRRR